MRLTRNYLLNFRNFTIAICFVFLALSAQAQTADVDKNWTTVGSAGTLDEKSVGKVFFDQRAHTCAYSLHWPGKIYDTVRLDWTRTTHEPHHR